MDLVKIFCFGYNFVYNLLEFFWFKGPSHQFVYAFQQLVKPFGDFILMFFFLSLSLPGVAFLNDYGSCRPGSPSIRSASSIFSRLAL